MAPSFARSHAPATPRSSGGPRNASPATEGPASVDDDLLSLQATRGNQAAIASSDQEQASARAAGSPEASPAPQEVAPAPAPTSSDPASLAKRICAAADAKNDAEALRLSQGTPSDQREGVKQALIALGRLDTLPVSVHRVFQPEAGRIEKVQGNGNIINCSSVIRFEGPITEKDILDAVYADWSPWFAGAAVHDHAAVEPNQGGGVKFHFDPVAFWATGHALFEANVHLLPFEKGNDVLKVPMTLSGDLEGSDVYFEFRKVGGGWIMRSVWNGVKENTPLSAAAVGKAHAQTEVDQLTPFMNAISPAIRGQRGYVGLKSFLEARVRGRPPETPSEQAPTQPAVAQGTRGPRGASGSW